MKRFFMTLAVCVGLVGTLPVQAQYVDGAPCAPVCDPGCFPANDCCFNSFDGWYIGAHVGWTFNERRWSDRDGWANEFTGDFSPGTLANTNDGVNAGLQLGYNWQCGCALYGLEIDGSWTDLQHTRHYSDTSGDVGVNALTLEDKLHWYGTLRGRAGIVCNDLLLYLTAGAAFAHSKFEWTIDDSAGDSGLIEGFSSHRTRWGLALGAGIEWAFSQCWSLKAEGLYLAFPQHTRTVFSTAADRDVSFDLRDCLWVGRVGVNFKLGNLFGCCW